MNEHRYCYSADRYTPTVEPKHSERMSAVARMLADATHAGDLKVRTFGIATRKVWFTLDGYVFEVKASHKA